MAEEPTRITLDTNAATPDVRKRLYEACREAELAVEIAHTTVTDRETEGTRFATGRASVAETGVYDESRYDSGAIYAQEPVAETLVWNESKWGESVWGGTVRESFVLDESRLDEGALAEDDRGSRLEAILQVIGNGSFPPSDKRESLTTGERRQLRDAMALEAHVREGRDVFVSDDVKAFVRGRRRELLESLCRTRIATVDEFCADPRGIG
jgi:hypothetical protein